MVRFFFGGGEKGTEKKKPLLFPYWPDFDREQLFDLEADPHEENDLVADPKYADQLSEMRKRFAVLKKEAN